MTLALAFEIIATILSLTYVLLLMKDIVWAWPAGISGSAIMAFSFFKADLFMETFTYCVYVVLGFYGWYYWLRGGKNEEEATVVKWRLRKHLILIITTALVCLFVGYLLTFTRESRPFFDTFTTVFALVATFMQARKVLSNWLYWIVINLASTVLYVLTDFWVYAGLSLVFTALSVKGYLSWKALLSKPKLQAGGE